MKLKMWIVKISVMFLLLFFSVNWKRNMKHVNLTMKKFWGFRCQNFRVKFIYIACSWIKGLIFNSAFLEVNIHLQLRFNMNLWFVAIKWCWNSRLTYFEVHKNREFTTDVGLNCPLFKQDYQDQALTFWDSVYGNRCALSMK